MIRLLQNWIIIGFILCFIFSCKEEKKDSLFFIDSSELTQYFNEEGGSVTITFNSNKNLQVSVSDSTWCNAEIWATTDKKKIIITVLPNPYKYVRNTYLNIFDTNNNLATVHIAQLGSNPAVLIPHDSIHISDNLEFSVKIVSNIPLKFNLPEWIKENEKLTSANVSDIYTFQITKLPSDITSREENIVIKGDSGNENIQKEILVIQEENLPRFIVISDVVMGSLNSKEKLERKLSNLLNKPNPVDAIFVVGDLTGRGAPTQYQELKNVCKSIVPEDIPMYFMMGNTDHFLEKSEFTFGNEMQQPIHQYFNIKGYPFITLSMRGIYTDRFTQEDKNFLLSSLRDATINYPGKPIFFFTHIGMSDTYYGTEKKITSNLGSEVLTPILSQFPNVIAFSGHTNYPLGDPRSIHQKLCTSVNIGSGIHSQIEYGYTEGMYPPNYQNVSEGLLVSVLENENVEIERWDTFRNEEILPKWEIKAPHNGSRFEYKHENKGNSPYFYPQDKAIVQLLEDDDYAVIFPAAQDDDVVHHYIIEVWNNEEIIFQNTRFSQFYLNSAAPKEFVVKLLSLPENIPLKASVKAIDSYDNASEPIVSENFIVQPFIPRDDIKVPVADLFDIQFEEKGFAKDISKNTVSVTAGETMPITYYNNKYGKYVARFSGNKTSFYKIDYTNNRPIKDAVLNSFSLEVVYLSNNLFNSAPLSGKEWEGLGIEQEEGGQIEFWAYMNDKYKKAKSAIHIEVGKYYHVVAMYDKKSAKMSIYVNGKKAGEIEAEGELLIPRRLDSRWFCIGGDTHPSGIIQHPLNGEVVSARMYSRILTDDEVYLLYQNNKIE